jgi:cytochrome c
MRCSNILVPLMALATCLSARAQSRAYDNLGRAAAELPPGSGTAKQGAPIYAAKCAQCHGPTGEGGIGTDSFHQRQLLLAGGKGTLATAHPLPSVGSFWPFATTIWDYINRAMPRGQGGTLSASEVYALTAFVLYQNDIIKEDDVMDAKSLPKVQMPNRNGFVPAWGEIIGKR